MKKLLFVITMLAAMQAQNSYCGQSHINTNTITDKVATNQSAATKETTWLARNMKKAKWAMGLATTCATLATAFFLYPQPNNTNYAIPPHCTWWDYKAPSKCPDAPFFKAPSKCPDAPFFNDKQTPNELRKEYKRLSFMCHPDHGGTTIAQQNLIEEYKQKIEEYEQKIKALNLPLEQRLRNEAIKRFYESSAEEKEEENERCQTILAPYSETIYKEMFASYQTKLKKVQKQHQLWYDIFNEWEKKSTTWLEEQLIAESECFAYYGDFDGTLYKLYKKDLADSQ